MNFRESPVAAFYDRIADIYEEEFESRAEYKVPKILMKEFDLHRFHQGSVLDIGCGTGKLKTHLNGKFELQGIEISENMAHCAVLNGYLRVRLGFAQDVVHRIPDKSYDFVVALSSLYFIQDIDLLIKECTRIARRSVFVSLEQFDGETEQRMRSQRMPIFNHSWPGPAAKLIQYQHLWTRPSNGRKIYGDLAHLVLAS